MARKVLISFLGTGPLESKEKRTYKTARYHLGDTCLGDYSFVAAALEKHYNIDSTFLVGTVHSMWEEVYRWHREKNGLELDENVYLEIADGCENANHLSPLSVPHKEEIERTLGNDSKVVLIKYGISEEEIKDNINTILGLVNYLKNGDELIVDVTHSFRSLPIFLMNLLIFIQNVSNKSITISHIHYGMLEMRNELGYAPIIDLKTILNLNDWITGAYSFSQFGNAYKISDLMNEENKSVATLLNEFSDLMNLNHLYAIRNVSQRLASIKNANYNTYLPKMIINPLVDNFVAQFRASRNDRDSVFQLKVARWQFNNRKYAQAFLTLTEAIISYVCEVNGLDASLRDNREEAKKALWFRSYSPLSCEPTIKTLYNDVYKLRNATAHAVETDNSTREMIKKLKDSLTEFEKICHK